MRKDIYQKVISEKTEDELLASKSFINKLLEYKTKCKQYKTYVKGVKDAIAYNGESRIYSSYNFSQTVTGRLSCSTYVCGPKMKKGVSFHTLPRPTDDNVNIRRLMKADGEKAFVAADFSQAELRVLAQCCKDENLIKAFTSGEDLHSFTASLVFSKKVEDVTKRERQIAKSVSFLIVYGGGPNKLAQQINNPVSDCKGIFKAYQDSFPNVFKWISVIHKSVRENGYAVSLFGRRRNLPNVNSPIKKYQYRALRQGLNFVIQSSASDLMLHSITRLCKDLKKAGVEYDLLATVHDSVELQCEVGDVEKCVEIMRSSLTSTYDLKTYYNLDFIVPFEVDIEVGTSFGDGMEVEFNDAGNSLNTGAIIKYVQSS